MGTLYTSQSAAGYNSSPPPDDGSQGANNQITWGTTIKAKLADPIKALADAINSQLTTALDLSPRAISTPDSAVASDHWRTLQVTGTTTITLSDAATMTSKYVVGIANLGVGTVTVTRATGANTVNGTAADFTIPPKASVVLGVNQAANGYNVLSSTGIALTSLTTPTVFTPIIDSGTTGSLSLKTNNGTTGFQVINAAGTIVNNLAVNGSTTGASVVMSAVGTDANIPIIISSKGNSAINFFTEGAATNQFQVLDTAAANRNITITGSNGGNPTIAATAGSPAITYADAGGSGTPSSHTFNMYEEGAWIPTVGGSATYTTQVGHYTRIGRTVHVRAIVKINAIGTGSTNTISGLPFTSNSTASLDTGLVVGGISGIGASVVSAYARIAPSTSAIILGALTAAGAAVSEAVTFFQNGAQVFVSGSYEL